LKYLTPDYVDASNNILQGTHITFLAAGTSSSNAAAYGSGANSKMRLGSSSAQVGFAGRLGVVFIVWYG
jgi:hypothetical protein